ncbi:hypothetical protein [Zavarzinia sp. CC-PAN008]|uniref:hypothetical protein n=1 Tax=Zavarzinia sp. CC-PAN008 TaxID=3243332 RepID=UPI003F7481EA
MAYRIHIVEKTGIGSTSELVEEATSALEIVKRGRQRGATIQVIDAKTKAPISDAMLARHAKRKSA